MYAITDKFHMTYTCDIALRRIVCALLLAVFALGLHGTKTLLKSAFSKCWVSRALKTSIYIF